MLLIIIIALTLSIIFLLTTFSLRTRSMLAESSSELVALKQKNTSGEINNVEYEQMKFKLMKEHFCQQLSQTNN